MLKMAPKRKNTDVLCVFADEFATEDMLKNAGLVNARLFFDHYHLQQNFERSFSPCTDLIRSYVFNMFRASSEDVLEYNYREALIIVRKYGTVVTSSKICMRNVSIMLRTLLIHPEVRGLAVHQVQQKIIIPV